MTTETPPPHTPTAPPSAPPAPAPAATALPPIAVSPKQAAALLSIDLSTYYRRIAPYVHSGAIASLKIASARRSPAGMVTP